jgi:hypothetical protein
VYPFGTTRQAIEPTFETVQAYGWQNSALGILMRGDNDYAPQVEILSKNAILSATVSTGYEDKFFYIRCDRQKPGGEIMFYKYSGLLRPTP